MLTMIPSGGRIFKFYYDFVEKITAAFISTTRISSMKSGNAEGSGKFDGKVQPAEFSHPKRFVQFWHTFEHLRKLLLILRNNPDFTTSKDFSRHAEMHDKLAVTAVRSNLKLKSEYFDLGMMICEFSRYQRKVKSTRNNFS